MYAIIRDGGKQYKVSEGASFLLEKKAAEAGSTIELDKVLYFSDGDADFRFGTPILDTVTVTAEILEDVKGEKIYVQKFKRRKKYRRKTGHRQVYTRVRIKEISAS